MSKYIRIQDYAIPDQTSRIAIRPWQPFLWNNWYHEAELVKHGTDKTAQQRQYLAPDELKKWNRKLSKQGKFQHASNIQISLADWWRQVKVNTSFTFWIIQIFEKLFEIWLHNECCEVSFLLTVRICYDYDHGFSSPASLGSLLNAYWPVRFSF